MRVLIVKVSSLGDIIHTLPAVTDAYRAKRGLRFDWVVEEAFAEIPHWHPAVDKVIPVAFRRWRKNLIKTWRSGEFSSRTAPSTHQDITAGSPPSGSDSQVFRSGFGRSGTQGKGTARMRRHIAESLIAGVTLVRLALHVGRRAAPLSWLLPDRKDAP